MIRIRESIALFASLIFFCTLASNAQTNLKSQVPDFRNFYGICWRGTPHDNLAYARQMGYKYVFYQPGMERDPLSNGLYFYIETPEYNLYNRVVDSKKQYSAKESDFYETYCTLKDTVAQFPANLATGWMWQVGSGVFATILDFRKQRVIDFAVDGIIRYAKNIESRNPEFHFAGLAWDDPRPDGDFWDDSSGKRVPVKLDRWNHRDIKSNGNTIQTAAVKTNYDFNNYGAGHLQFFKQLRSKVLALYPNAHFIGEPYDIYKDWIQYINDKPDASEYVMDILSQEGSTMQFIDDKRVTGFSLVKKENIYCTTPNEFSEQMNRQLACRAAVSGENFGWFGRFGGTGNMPNFKNISEVPPRLKLIRMLTNWENLNSTPLTARNWDGNVYQSKTAFISADAIAIIQPKTHKLFVVFLTPKAQINIPDGSGVKTVFKTDDLFRETDIDTTGIVVQGTKLSVKDQAALNNGYIITLK